ncbi:hypothetical protein B9Z45_15060, partial [Limnohabitans sp. 2KL-17]|uniref:hypothetical protein n=1 Tax=Limnohabitans sp. 2KL-17 TaxID=1100704 RepID=UPI000DD23763
MSSIVVHQLSAQGKLSRAESASHDKSSKVLRVQVEPSARLSVQIDGANFSGNTLPSGKKPILKKSGKNLLLEVDEETLIEFTDFYAVQGAVLDGEDWHFATDISLTTPGFQADSAELPVLETASPGQTTSPTSPGGSAFGGIMLLGVAASAGVALAKTGAVASLPENTDPPVNPPAPQSVVSGMLTGGPVISGSRLKVVLYKADGSLINGTEAASTALVDDQGRYSINVGSYTGVVIAKVVDDNGTAPDYMDEATGVAVDLNANYMAVGVVDSANLTLHINPLTTLAAIKAGLQADGSGTVTADQVVKANAAIAKAVGLTGVLTTLLPDVTNDDKPGANAIGRVLAALSGLDAMHGGDAQTTLAMLAQQMDTSGSQMIVSPAFYSALLKGAAKAQQGNPLANGGLLGQMQIDLTNLKMAAADKAVAEEIAAKALEEAAAAKATAKADAAAKAAQDKAAADKAAAEEIVAKALVKAVAAKALVDAQAAFNAVKNGTDTAAITAAQNALTAASTAAAKATAEADAASKAVQDKAAADKAAAEEIAAKAADEVAAAKALVAAQTALTAAN